LLATRHRARQGAAINKFQLTTQGNTSRQPAAGDTPAGSKIGNILRGYIAFDRCTGGQYDFADIALG